MILKLYNLSKLQLNQNIIKQNIIKSKINEIDKKIDDLETQLSRVSVEKYGAIGDFKLLALHKNTLRYEKSILCSHKNILNKDLIKYDKIIIKYQKDIEKYRYLLSEEEKQKTKKIQIYEESIANEYVQSKYINKINT
jgi:hypothetical protein